MIKRYLLSALLAPLGAVAVYTLLMVVLPFSVSDESIWVPLYVGVIAYIVELLVAPLALTAIRLRMPFSVPASSLLAGVVITQLIGIPAVSFGAWNPTSLPIREALSASLVFAVVALVKSVVFARPNESGSRDEAALTGLNRHRALALLLASLMLWAAAGLIWRELTVYWFTPPQVEAFLLDQTPLGTSEADVLRWLESRGVAATIARAKVPPNSKGRDYPLTVTGGEAFIHETVAEYRLIFWAAIEAFYSFDGSGRLVDVRVRRTIDSL